MNKPILTIKEIRTISKAVVPSFAEWTASCEAYARAIEQAVLERVLGEPIYQISFSDDDGWWDTHKEFYDEHRPHMRRIVYALKTGDES